MIYGDDQSRRLEDISAAEERITRYINTNRAGWCDPHEAKLAGMIAELEALYEDAGINIFDRRYSAEDVDAAFRVAADTGKDQPPMATNLEAGDRGPGYYKTTITIYSEFDPSTTELTGLAREATDGMAICTGQTCEIVLANDLPDEAASFFHREDDSEPVLTLDGAGAERAAELAGVILAEPDPDEREKRHEERRQEAMFELANLITDAHAKH